VEEAKTRGLEVLVDLVVVPAVGGAQAVCPARQVLAVASAQWEGVAVNLAATEAAAAGWAAPFSITAGRSP
jgi:hypothetical protein